MISVERIHPVVYKKALPSTALPLPKSEIHTDLNSNMRGTALVSDGKSTKIHQAGSQRSDRETLLLILNNALNTHHKRSPLTCTSVNRTGTVSPHKNPTSQSSEKSHETAYTTMVQQKTTPSPDQESPIVDISSKIEQAMDSVKAELLLTVRKEVRELKSQVERLQQHNSHLEEENRILRSAATPETLAMLSCNTHMSSVPPSRETHSSS